MHMYDVFVGKAVRIIIIMKVNPQWTCPQQQTVVATKLEVGHQKAVSGLTYIVNKHQTELCTTKLSFDSMEVVL